MKHNPTTLFLSLLFICLSSQVARAADIAVSGTETPVLATESTAPLAQSKTQAQAKIMGVGIAFGTSFQEYQKKAFSRGIGNFFQIKFAEQDGSTYYLHNEQSAFNVTTGDAFSTGTQDLHGIGVLTSLSESFFFNFMVGGANVSLPAALSITGGSESISASHSTSSVADLGVKWSSSKSPLKLLIGIDYRASQLGHKIIITDTEGNKGILQDKSSLKMNFEVSRSF